MNKEQYLEHKYNIETEYKTNLDSLDTYYCQQNNKVKIGNIVSDREKTILVDRIDAIHYPDSEFPECVYRGRVLTSASMSGTIFERNILDIDGKLIKGDK